MSNISPCDMKGPSRECIHWWTIGKYSCTVPEQGGKLRSEKFSAADDDLYWCLEYTRYVKDMDHVMVSINLRPDCYDDLKKCESVSGTADIYLGNVHGYSAHSAKRYYIELSNDEQNRNCKLFEWDMKAIEKYVSCNTLTIMCRIIYHKKNETVTTSSSSNNSNTIRISGSRLSSDMERCFPEDCFKDVTISVKGKEYRAHKNILATRSTVFDKMLSVDMLESEKNHIDITDIDHEPFEEMLYYIYTGMVKNLDELADKHDLNELRSMCEEVLVKKLTTDDAVKILILADTHRSEKLKTHTLRFMKENYESFEDFNDTEFWKHLFSVNAELFKEVMAAFCKRQKLD